MTDKMIDSRSYRNERLKDKEFRKEYDAVSAEYSLAKDIHRMRIEARLTQGELAEKAGTSQPAIARLESGNARNVTWKFISRVAHALGMEPEIHFRRK